MKKRINALFSKIYSISALAIIMLHECPSERAFNIESSLNKVSAFMADGRIGARLAQKKSSFNIKHIMDTRGILLINLAKGKLAINADLFGALIINFH